MKRRIAGLALLLTVFSAHASAQTAAVTSGDLQKTIYGSGVIEPLRQPGVYAEISGKVLDYYVGLGDHVEKGDVLMQLENDDLAAETAQLEYEIQLTLDDVVRTKTHSQYKYLQLYDEMGDPRIDVNTGEPLLGKYSNEISIRCPSDGRIMAVYIEPGDDALAVYREHGSVVMLSTDGRMKVELEGVEGVKLELDEIVRISGEGLEIEGKVVALARRGTDVTVQVMSDDYPMGAPVTVWKVDGTLLGESVLEINKPMAVSAYGGTIKGLYWNIKVGEYLKRDDVIARIEWSEIPLYIDNDRVLHAHAKAKTQLEMAREKQEALAIAAPCSGRVVSIDVEKGDNVEDGAKLITLVSDEGMRMVMAIDELDIIHVKPGQEVRMVLDALEDVELTGTVEKIAPLGNTETAVTTYDVYVTLTGDVDSRVLGGMNVIGEIVIDEADDALLIPTDALRRNETGWCVTMDNGEERTIEIGLMTDDMTHVLSGLAEGEIIQY